MGETCESFQLKIEKFQSEENMLKKKATKLQQQLLNSQKVLNKDAEKLSSMLHEVNTEAKIKQDIENRHNNEETESLNEKEENKLNVPQDQAGDCVNPKLFTFHQNKQQLEPFEGNISVEKLEKELKR